MRSYISDGRLSETLLLLSAIKNYHCNTIDDTDQLTVGLLINKQAAYDFAIQCAWIKQNEGIIEFTDRGNSILQEFNGHEIRPQLWRDILFDYISICRPAWANMIPNGRKEVYLFMTNDEKRCFNEANLMAPTDEATVEWWDKVASLFRDLSQDVLENIGREGERKTLFFEERRTGVKPHWESIDSNCSGYDIVSKQERGSNKSILIEVKSSSKELKDASMLISRNEWNVASCDYNINRYYFYLWLLGKAPRLAIIPATQLKPHVPLDTGKGTWKTLSIPFDLFRYDFFDFVE